VNHTRKQMIEKEFFWSRDKEIHKFPRSHAVRKYNTADGTVAKWEKKYGIAKYVDPFIKKYAALHADPDFGMKTKKARVSLNELGRRHGMDGSTALRQMSLHGIESFNPQKKPEPLNDIQALYRRVGWA
jgi:hypothetical protein